MQETVGPISIKYEHRCIVCGFAIRQSEIGGIFTGSYIDYINPSRGEANFTFCTECFGSMREHAQEAPSKSLERRHKLDRDNRNQRQEIESKDP